VSASGAAAGGAFGFEHCADILAGGQRAQAGRAANATGRVRAVDDPVRAGSGADRRTTDNGGHQRSLAVA
jgi:hypothetical protein